MDAAATEAAEAADLILIPCRPGVLDLRAIGATVKVARLAGKPAAVVLNAVPARSAIAAEAPEAVAGYGVQLVPVQIGQRAAFNNALVSGQVAQEYEPDGKAADEIRQLYKWACQQLGLN